MVLVMDMMALKKEIMERTIQNFYIFTGTEIGIQNIYLNQMSKVLGKPINREDNVKVIYPKLTTKSLFGGGSGFYVIRDDTDFLKDEKLYTNLMTNIGDNYVVVLYEKLDSRLKFSKYFKDCTICFEKLSTSILKYYIKNTCGINDKNAQHLCDIVSNSYDLAMSECDKVNHLAKLSNYDSNRAYTELIRCGGIWQPSEIDVFKFTDSVCNRRKDSFGLIDVLRQNDIPVLNALGTLYNSMKNILLIQVCENSDIANTTGLDGGQIYFNKKYVGKYASSELVQAIKLISACVDGIKSGKIDEKFALQYILVQIL